MNVYQHNNVDFVGLCRTGRIDIRVQNTKRVCNANETLFVVRTILSILYELYIGTTKRQKQRKEKC